MEIKKPRSHTPTIHDNTEEDLILVPPSVLQGKLHKFEDYVKGRGSLGSDVAVAIALLITLLTTNFKDFVGVSAGAIEGAFIAALVFMIAKIVFDFITKVHKAPIKTREDVVESLIEKSENKQK
ncbi:MAG: hypothetical protein ABSE68_00435 [Minisyncoccia bacterium]